MRKLINAPSIASLCCALLIPSVKAEPSLLATHDDVEVYLVRCEAGQAALHLQARAPEVYFNARSGVGKFLRTMQYIVPSQCENVQRVTLKGTVGDELWFAAATTIEDKWEVTSITKELHTQQ